MTAADPFESGAWRLVRTCTTHENTYEQRDVLEFASGRVRWDGRCLTTGRVYRVSGTYDRPEGRCQLEQEYEDGVRRVLSGMAEGSAIWGTWTAFEKGRPTGCRGGFRMWRDEEGRQDPATVVQEEARVEEALQKSTPAGPSPGKTGKTAEKGR